MPKSLCVQASIGARFSSVGSTLDHFIWDETVARQDPSKWCETITVWTRDAEFNLLVFGNGRFTERVRCAYFPTASRGLYKKHIEYWDAVGLASENLTGKKRKLRPAEIPKLLPILVIWNRYERQNCTAGGVDFRRLHAVAVDQWRQWFETIPLPTKFLDFNLNLKKKDPKDRAHALYSRALERYAWVAGRGSPMLRNLQTLSSLLADSHIRTALVTGEPGTGKENYCKAIYFGNKLRQPLKQNSEAIFLRTTAGEIEAGQRKNTASGYLRRRIRALHTPPPDRPKSPVIFIDELNKASDKLLAGLLRTLEQGEEELQVKDDPKFILAASQHIDDLARMPPQDFWSRVSHQLRVAHPLSRVSEEDGEAFLSSFFFSNWWDLVEEMVRNLDGTTRDAFIEVFLFLKDRKNEWTKSNLCKHVHEEFINALVPLVSRDTLSVRGARSILSQVFARLSWFVRYEKPFAAFDTDSHVARLVNAAIQDVLAILNAARATPSAMAQQKSAKD